MDEYMKLALGLTGEKRDDNEIVTKRKQRNSRA